MTIHADPNPNPSPSRKTTFTFLDSASLYEVAAVLGIGKPQDCYPWAWRTAVTVTHSLIEVKSLRVAPAPGGSKDAGRSKSVV